jgi:transcriptional regulator with XRE-family HTH domain
MLEPEAHGIPRGRRRLAKGLRREEVAERAETSVVWYTWLEQGRPINISDETLRRIASALKLNGEETAYVFQLAGKLVPAEIADELVVSVGPDIQAALDAFDGPASAMNVRYDVIGWNALAARVFDYERGNGWRNNRVWSKFFDPAAKERFRDWRHSAENLVAMLRSMSTPYRGDPRFEALFTELARSAEFVEIWENAGVGREPTSVLELRVDGRNLDVYSIRATLPSAPGIVLFFNPPADVASKKVLEGLREPRPCAPRSSVAALSG